MSATAKRLTCDTAEARSAKDSILKGRIQLRARAHLGATRVVEIKAIRTGTNDSGSSPMRREPGQNPSRHGDRRPGDRASPQTRPVLLRRRTRQRPRTGEASGQGRADRSAAPALRPRHPRRTRLLAVQRLRRTLALPPVEQALRAHQRHHHDQSYLWRMADRLRRGAFGWIRLFARRTRKDKAPPTGDSTYRRPSRS